MIISRFPPGQPVTERAIPTPIFNTEPKIRNYFLRKWSKDSSITDFDIRNFIDWEYYIDRFSTTIRKIITIPAGIQNIDNPVSRVKEPDWLKRMMQYNRSLNSQRRISDMFKRSTRTESRPSIVSYTDEPFDEEEVDDKEMLVEEPVVEEEEEPVKPRHSVKRNEDFSEWLEERKKKWLSLTKRQNISLTPSSTENSYFQVLEVQPCSDKNEVLLFVLNTANQLQRLHIQVDHTLYVNSKVPLTDKHLIPTGLTLPYQSYGSGSSYVYSITVKEDEVQDTISAIQKTYDVDSIEGIYNSKLPSLFNVILNTGCVCRIILPTSVSSLGILKHVTNTSKGSLHLNNIIFLSQEVNPYLTYSLF